MTRLQDEAKAARKAQIISVLRAVPILLVGSALTLLVLRVVGLLNVEKDYIALTEKYKALESSQNVMVWQMDSSCYDQLKNGSDATIQLVK